MKSTIVLELINGVMNLVVGVRDLHLIPLDPLQVPSLDFGQDTGPVSLTWKFNNATIKGTSSAIVKYIR